MQHRTEQRVRLCLKERRKKRDDATKFYRKSRGAAARLGPVGKARVNYPMLPGISCEAWWR